MFIQSSNLTEDKRCKLCIRKEVLSLLFFVNMFFWPGWYCYYGDLVSTWLLMLENRHYQVCQPASRVAVQFGVNDAQVLNKICLLIFLIWTTNSGTWIVTFISTCGVIVLKNIAAPTKWHNELLKLYYTNNKIFLETFSTF